MRVFCIRVGHYKVWYLADEEVDDVREIPWPKEEPNRPILPAAVPESCTDYDDLASMEIMEAHDYVRENEEDFRRRFGGEGHGSFIYEGLLRRLSDTWEEEQGFWLAFGPVPILDEDERDE